MWLTREGASLMSKRYLGAGRDLNSGSKLINCVDPTNAQDAATKAYVDSVLWTPQANILTSPTATINSTTLVNGPVITIPTAGTYWFCGDVGIVGNGTDCVLGIQLSGTMTTTAYRFMANFTSLNAVANDVSTNTSGTTLSTAGLSWGSQGISPGQQGGHISGTFTASVVGTCAIAMSRISGTGTFTIRSGSNIFVQRLS